MSDTKMFRSQIGGFNRDDVNNYIKETDLKHSAEIEALNQKIAELSEKADELNSLNDSLSQLEAKLAVAENERNTLSVKLTAAEKASVIKANELAEKEKELADTLKSVAFYKSESEAQIKVIAEKKDEIEALNKSHIKAMSDIQENLNAEKRKCVTLEQEKKALISEQESLSAKFDELANALEAAKNFNENADDKNSPAYKVGMYDKISSQLGDILINANRNADALISSAKEESERILSEAEQECEQKRNDCNEMIAKTKAETDAEAMYIRKRLSQTANELLNSISSDLHTSIENCMREINTSFTDIRYEFKTLLSKIETRSGELNDRVDYYHSCLSEGIETKLAEMDGKYGLSESKNGENTDA